MIESNYLKWIESFEQTEVNWSLVQKTWQVFANWLDENDSGRKNEFGSYFSDTFLAWAEKSEKRSDPGLALSQYQFLENLPGSAPEGVKEKILELTVSQGNYYLSNEDTDEALAAYFELMDDYLSADEVAAFGKQDCLLKLVPCFTSRELAAVSRSARRSIFLEVL